MKGSKSKQVFYGLLFVYTVCCFAVWILETKNSSSDLAWTTVLPISALAAILVALYTEHRSKLRAETDYWLLKTKELELEADKRSKELKQKNHQLQNVLEDIHHLGYYDALTNLPNRRLFIKQLSNALARARKKNYVVAVLFIDLDNFKMLNDTMGHIFGDLVLRELGLKIKKSIREIDTVSRQGGDEFTLFLDEINNVEQAKQLIQDIHRSIQEPFLINDIEIQIKSSIGAALFPRHGDDIDNLIKYADIAMFNAKELGKNRFVIYSAEMNTIFLRRMFLDKELRSAIRNQEFNLYYQPQININSGEIIGIEALIRWNNSALGDVKPSEIIPIAEENGQIIPLGEWVLANACRQMKTWLDEGYIISKMAVNISPIQFNDEKLVDNVKRILRETGLKPQFLELEITEGVAIYNEKTVLSKLLALKDIGIRVSLDDFGTGFSCLAYLSQYPVDTIKIDRSFMKDILINVSNQILVETIVIMAHNFKISVTAEGVDTPEQFQLLKEYKCDDMQGYLISPPVSAEQVVNLVDLYSEKPSYHHQASVS